MHHRRMKNEIAAEKFALGRAAAQAGAADIREAIAAKGHAPAGIDRSRLVTP